MAAAPAGKVQTACFQASAKQVRLEFAHDMILHQRIHRGQRAELVLVHVVWILSGTIGEVKVGQG